MTNLTALKQAKADIEQQIQEAWSTPGVSPLTIKALNDRQKQIEDDLFCAQIRATSRTTNL